MGTTAHESRKGNTTAKNNSRGGLMYEQLLETSMFRGKKQVHPNDYPYRSNTKGGLFSHQQGNGSKRASSHMLYSY